MQKVMMSGVRKVRRSCIEVFSVKIREHFMNYAVQICMSWMDLSYAILQNEECQLMWSMQFKSSRNPVFGHSGVPEVWVRGSSGVRKIRKLWNPGVHFFKSSSDSEICRSVVPKFGSSVV